MIHVPPFGSCICMCVPISGLRERQEPGIGFSSKFYWGGGVARSENVLTLPMAVHFDDTGLIGPPGTEVATDAM
eukprot:5554375-Pleurochrysis_carterae.AAC.1